MKEWTSAWLSISLRMRFRLAILFFLAENSPAAMVLDAVTRLIPGALGNEDSAENESFSAPPGNLWNSSSSAQQGADSFAPAARGILDYPHYTRPKNFRSWEVPEVLVSGNHEEVRRWRARTAIEKTRRNRPDLLASKGSRAETKASGEID